jgi:hypothetical protein
LILLAFPLSADAQNGITKFPDLNGDGKADLLWTNPANGQTVAWLMDGTGAMSSAALLSDPAWKVIKTADLNGDGNTDLIVYNASAGQTVAWMMSGTTVTGWTLLLTAPDWKVIETADLNGDGKTDLIWYNASTGQTAAWLMNGATATSWTVLLTDADWKVIATADLNGDRNADLIWYNASLNQTAAWLMNGTTAVTWSVLLTAPDWKVVSAADFNGDGKADLLWYNAVIGQTAMWLMNGTSTVSWTALPTDPNWKIAATADLNGDGKADIIFNNALTGQKIAWLMNGSSVIGSASLLTSLNWNLAAAADLNNDGKADLLWYNSSTGQTAAWLMNGTTPISGANLFTDPNWRLNCIKGTSVTTGIACDDTVFSAATGTVPVNQTPIVNAGADLSITLPAVANLAGNASDDGAPIALLISTWSQVIGPGTVTFGNPSSLQTTAAFTVAGTYTLRLTVSDSMFSTSDDVVVTVNAAGATPINKAPVVNAGPDQTTTLSAGANLLGSVSDDGLPTGSAVTKTWSKVSGPGNVTFGNASSVTTTATFSVAGTYTLRLTANDSLLSSSDDVVITVNASSSTNQAPVVNAGPDQMITFPAAAMLSGAATDDGLPAGSTLTKTWSKVSGPGIVSFGNASSLIATASFSATGSYTLRLTVSDGLLSSSDDIVIVVSPAPVNQAPVVNAGTDKSIVLPAGIALTGTASDDGLPSGSSLTVSWSKVSGPTGSVVVFVNANSLNASATFSVAGTYTLRLTASDGALTASDDVIVTVAAPANQAPVVNAGPDQIVTYPSAAMMAGTATDDGLPTGSTLTRTWSMVSGPGTVTFINGNLLNATATFSTAGSYTLRLTVSDGSLSASDDMIVTVIAAQACGTTVSGSLTVSATATDNVGVVGVQFKLDGANLGAELIASPYSYLWNTATAVNGCHTLSAVARDAAGNLGTTSLQVSIGN